MLQAATEISSRLRQLNISGGGEDAGELSGRAGDAGEPGEMGKQISYLAQCLNSSIGWKRFSLCALSKCGTIIVIIAVVSQRSQASTAS